MTVMSTIRTNFDVELEKLRSALDEVQSTINELNGTVRVQENGPRKSREALANEKQQLDNDLQTTEQSLSDALSKIEVLKSTNAMHEEMFRNSKTKWEHRSKNYATVSN